MTDRDRKKGELIHLFKNCSSDQEKTNSVSISGNNNILGNNNNVAGRDIINQIVEKPVRPINKFTPDPDYHIKPPVTGKIQRLIYKLADIEATAGNGEIGKLRTSWWSKLNKQFGVGTYREIPATKGEQAITWLQQHVAMNRSKLRKTDKQSWRNEHYKAIWARSRQLGLSRADVYALAKDRFEIQIISLKQLSDSNLKKLYGMIMGK